MRIGHSEYALFRNLVRIHFWFQRTPFNYQRFSRHQNMHFLVQNIVKNHTQHNQQHQIHTLLDQNHWLPLHQQINPGKYHLRTFCSLSLRFDIKESNKIHYKNHWKVYGLKACPALCLEYRRVRIIEAWLWCIKFETRPKAKKNPFLPF